MADFAFVLEVFHGAHGFVHGGFVVGPVDEVDVDVVGAEDFGGWFRTGP